MTLEEFIAPNGQGCCPSCGQKAGLHLTGVLSIGHDSLCNYQYQCNHCQHRGFIKQESEAQSVYGYGIYC